MVLGVLLQRRHKTDTEQIMELYEKQLDEARHGICERDNQLAARSQELRMLQAEFASTRRSLVSAEALAGQLRQSVAESQFLPGKIQERDIQLAQLHSDTDAMRADYASEVADLRRRLGDADAQRTQLARYQQQLHTLDARLASVQRDKEQAIVDIATRLAELEPPIQRPISAVAPIATPALVPALLAEPVPPPATADTPVRELERDLARLRQRILQLEGLHLVIQNRDYQIEQLKKQQMERDS